MKNHVTSQHSTHDGPYCYKRLMFGVTSAPEIYMYQQALHGCEGMRNMSDEIILYGKDDQQHDERLEKTRFVSRSASSRCPRKNS